MGLDGERTERRSDLEERGAYLHGVLIGREGSGMENGMPKGRKFIRREDVERVAENRTDLKGAKPEGGGKKNCISL